MASAAVLLVVSCCLLALGPPSRTGALNVALKKQVKFCSVTDLSILIVDGIRQPDVAERVSGMCGPMRPYVIVDFRAEHFVHYVVVYEGTPGPGETSRGELDYFSIYHIQSFRMVPCNRFPTVSLGHEGDIGMRVNCWNSEATSKKIILLSDRTYGLNLAEIEVHTLARNDKDYIWIFRGCFPLFNYRMKFKMVTWQDCRIKCFVANFTFAAVMNNQTCYCGFVYAVNDELPEEDCKYMCSSSETFTCGGNTTYSIYLVNLHLPRFYGCLTYRVIRRGRNYLKRYNMTVATCLNFCKEYLWAILQNGTICECRNDATVDFGREVDAPKCDSACSGDQTSVCGGTTVASVYRTCQFSNSTVSACALVQRCSGLLDQHGVCLDGCDPGFIGDHCIDKGYPFFSLIPYIVAGLLSLVALIACSGVPNPMYKRCPKKLLKLLHTWNKAASDNEWKIAESVYIPEEKNSKDPN